MNKSTKAVAVTVSKTARLKELGSQLHTAAPEAKEMFVSAHRQGVIALEKAAICGRIMIEAKALVDRGDWVDWLKSNAKEISLGTCYNFMRIAKFQSTLKFDEQTTLRQVYVEAGIMRPRRKALNTPSSKPSNIIDAEVVSVSVSAAPAAPLTEAVPPVKPKSAAEVKKIAADLKNESLPRGGLAAEAREQDAMNIGGWKGAVLEALEQLWKRTQQGSAYTSGSIGWMKYHEKVVDCIKELR